MEDNTPGYVSNELYTQITAVFPVVCIDVILFDVNANKIGVIERATGKEAGKLATIGGRIKKGETIQKAIARHLWNDLQINDFTFYQGNSPTRPFYIQQYVHGNAPTDDFRCYDPTKQSIGLTYIIETNEKAIAQNEATELRWVGESEIPASTAFNQGVLMHEAFAFLKSNAIS